MGPILKVKFQKSFNVFNNGPDSLELCHFSQLFHIVQDHLEGGYRLENASLRLFHIRNRIMRKIKEESLASRRFRSVSNLAIKELEHSKIFDLPKAKPFKAKKFPNTLSSDVPRPIAAKISSIEDSSITNTHSATTPINKIQNRSFTTTTPIQPAPIKIPISKKPSYINCQLDTPTENIYKAPILPNTPVEHISTSENANQVTNHFSSNFSCDNIGKTEDISHGADIIYNHIPIINPIDFSQITPELFNNTLQANPFNNDTRFSVNLIPTSNQSQLNLINSYLNSEQNSLNFDFIQQNNLLNSQQTIPFNNIGDHQSTLNNTVTSNVNFSHNSEQSSDSSLGKNNDMLNQNDQVKNSNVPESKLDQFTKKSLKLSKPIETIKSENYTSSPSNNDKKEEEQKAKLSEERDENAPFCSNCGAKKTPLWRRAPDNYRLCNACGLYYKLHNTHRPLKKCKSKSGKRQEYEPKNIKCTRCSVVVATLWRRDPVTNLPVCNPCGLFKRINKRDRPEHLYKNKIKKRVRKPSPKVAMAQLAELEKINNEETSNEPLKKEVSPVNVITEVHISEPSKVDPVQSITSSIGNNISIPIQLVNNYEANMGPIANLPSTFNINSINNNNMDLNMNTGFFPILDSNLLNMQFNQQGYLDNFNNNAFLQQMNLNASINVASFSQADLSTLNNTNSNLNKENEEEVDFFNNLYMFQ